MSAPNGTVVVLNWQGEDWLDGCLSTLLRQTAENYQVLVVDNGSTDNSANIAARYDVEWLPLRSNIGFSRGNNEGARRVRGDWLIFANNDMRFDERFIETVVRHLYAEEDVFAIDVAQRDWNGNLSHGALRVISGSPFTFEETFPTRPTTVPFGNGGALCVRRDRYEALGGFDERMFAGSEDVDLSWRAWLRGWKTVYLPQVLCEAKIGGASSTPDGRRLRRRAVVVGRLVFASKHLPVELAIREWTTLGLRAVLRPSLAGGVFEVARQLPNIVRERRQLYEDISPRTHFGRMRALVGGPAT